MYRVVYLERGQRAWLPGNYSLAQAEKFLRMLKRRGLTAWIVDADTHAFVPVTGAKSAALRRLAEERTESDVVRRRTRRRRA